MARAAGRATLGTREGLEHKDGAQAPSTSPQALDKIERECIPGLVNVLREDGLEAVRYFLWDVTGRHHHSQA